MEKGRTIKQNIFLFFCAVLLSAVWGLCTAQTVSESQYQNAAGFVSALTEGAAIPQALKQTALQTVNIESGKALLKQYGYRPNNIFWKNSIPLFFQGSGMFVIFLCLVLTIQNHNQKRLMRRLDGLTQYLEKVNLGKETLLVRHEDMFSRLEDEIYKTVTELRFARNTALKERQILSDNLADISHQLKTPLTSMSLMAQLLADQCQEGQTPYLERMSHQITRLERLTSSLLTLSRLDAGTLKLEPKKVGVYSLLAQAAEPIEEIAQNKGVCLTIQSQPDEEIWTDINWTAEAILNLIKNCVEHTPSGGRVLIQYDNNPLYLQVTIQDTGSGFEPQEIPFLFQRYFRGKGAAKDSIGIGLALSRSILEKQGGMIRADNPSEGGARFTVKFYHLTENYKVNKNKEDFS